MAKFTPRQEKFIVEYLKDQNATKAAKRAGYSRDSAYSQGCRLLKNAEIFKAIQDLLKKVLDENGVQVADIVRGLKGIADINIRDAYDKNGQPLPIHLIPPEIVQFIQSYDEEPVFLGDGDKRKKIGVIRKIRFYNKLDALRDLGKYKKMFGSSDTLEVTGPPVINVIKKYPGKDKSSA